VGPASPPDSNHSNTSLRNELQVSCFGEICKDIVSCYLVFV
jgi:hypothetical protein